MFVCFVDIGGIFVYHCYDFLFILMQEACDDAVDIGGIFIYHCYEFLFILMKEAFDDAKRVIRISKSKKDRQHHE